MITTTCFVLIMLANGYRPAVNLFPNSCFPEVQCVAIAADINKAGRDHPSIGGYQGATCINRR